MSFKIPFSPRPYTLACVFLGALSGGSLLAANTTWVGNTDANFSTLANWNALTPNGNTPLFGTAGSSGTTLNNDIVGATFNGLTFNVGASAYTIGGNSFTLGGNITNSSASLQTINNSFTGFGGRTIAGGTGGLVLGGTVNSTGSSALNGTVAVTGATTIDGGATSAAGWIAIGSSTAATVTISNGGSLAIKGTTNGTKPNSTIGQVSGSSTVNVGATDKSTSGTFTVEAGTGLLLGNSGGSGTLNVYSGTATINRGTVATTTNGVDNRLVMMGRDSGSSTGTVNLNGGTLATDRQFVRDGSSSAGSGTANFVFNGGTLKALATQTDWLQSTTATSAGQNIGNTGGTVNTNALALSSVTTTAVSTIDANGFSVAINNNISGAGGFNANSSTGTGTVTLGGTGSTYTGGTTVTAGTLNVVGLSTTSGSYLGNGAVTINGGTLTINASGVGALTGVTNFTLTTGIASFDIASLASFDSIAGTGSFAINGGTIKLTGTLTSAADTYAILSGFSGNTVGTFSFDLSGLSGSTGLTASLSNSGVVSFTAVPEPHQYALVFSGLLAVLIVARRRRMAQS